MAKQSRLNITSASRRYPPVGRCIYCGEQNKVLGDEHILPYAIAGNSLVLPKAGCRNCEKANSAFELPIHRKQLGPLRTVLGFPTRNRRNRPTNINLGLGNFSKFEVGETAVHVGEIDVPIEKFPITFATIRLGPPGILLGLPLECPLPWSAFVRLVADEHRSPFQYGANVARICAVNPFLTAQYLARIAYSYAVSELGYGTFQPLVLDLLKRKGGFFRHWVGGQLSVPPANKLSLHTLEQETVLVGPHKYVVVTLRLFANLGSPIHQVVVGQLDG
ncbi:MAG: hypothetical protein H6874_05435 [Hyphomicrobiaceae bacterium]|nr:hypothetical protein [Hyphomicrobiaceae bacterium]